jgi:hypothetical protein
LLGNIADQAVDRAAAFVEMHAAAQKALVPLGVPALGHVSSRP